MALANRWCGVSGSWGKCYRLATVLTTQWRAWTANAGNTRSPSTSPMGFAGPEGPSGAENDASVASNEQPDHPLISQHDVWSQPNLVFSRITSDHDRIGSRHKRWVDRFWNRAQVIDGTTRQNGDISLTDDWSRTTPVVLIREHFS